MSRERRERIARTEYEITVPEERILRHICHQAEPGQETTRLKVIDAAQRPLPVWRPDSFYLANIGKEGNPLFLELRFALLSKEKSEYIALLMATERGSQIKDIAQGMIEVVEQEGIEFDAALGIPALGVPLAQAMGEIKGPDFYWTTCQKGRSDAPIPKPWLDPDISYRYRSGTKPYEQVLYLDPVLVDVLSSKRIVIADDARLTGGSVEAMVKFTQQLDLNPVGVVSVLNEADLIDEIEGIPYFGLVKIPIFLGDEQGFHPIEGTFERVSVFYQEI